MPGQEVNTHNERIGQVSVPVNPRQRGGRCREFRCATRFAKIYFANSRMASSAKMPPVIVIGAKGAFAATSALESMIWSILVASCCVDAAKTKRLMRHHRIAPMHIAQGSPDV